jgi:DNA-directed RNA polymerase specialized sigma24 family protein
MEILEQARIEGWSDEQVVERVLAGDTALYEIIMRRYNQRLYRVVISILRDSAETEDVMQDAYVRAYQHLSNSKAEHLSPPGLRESPSMKRWHVSEAATECNSWTPKWARERFPWTLQAFPSIPRRAHPEPS